VVLGKGFQELGTNFPQTLRRASAIASDFMGTPGTSQVKEAAFNLFLFLVTQTGDAGS